MIGASRPGQSLTVVPHVELDSFLTKIKQNRIMTFVTGRAIYTEIYTELEVLTISNVNR